jgi:hypothetical protein
LSLFTPFRSSPRPWLMVSPRVPEYVTASWRTLFGLQVASANTGCQERFGLG